MNLSKNSIIGLVLLGAFIRVQAMQVTQKELTIHVVEHKVEEQDNTLNTETNWWELPLHDASIALSVIRKKFLEKTLTEYKIKNNLRSYIDWPKQFEILKTRTHNLKEHVQDYIKKIELFQHDTCLSYYELYNDSFLNTALGFKPLTIETQDNIKRQNKSFNKEQYVPYQKHASILHLETLEWAFCKKKERIKKYWYCANKEPLFPLRFVWESYSSSIIINTSFAQEIENGTVLDEENIEKHVKYFIDNAESGGILQQEYALLLGLQPTAYETTNGVNDAQSQFFKKPERFNYLLLPGIVDVFDECDYPKLYAMMSEYALCVLSPEHYIEYILYRIMKQYDSNHPETKEVLAIIFKDSGILPNDFGREGTPNKALVKIMYNFFEQYIKPGM